MSLHTAKFNQYRIRKIRDAIPSVPGMLEQLRKNPQNTALGKYTNVVCVYTEYVHVHRVCVCIYVHMY